MSQFSYDVSVETGDITFTGVLSLKDIADWDSEASEFLNVFMKIEGKNKISAQVGALSLLFEAIENQQGTEVEFTPIEPKTVPEPLSGPTNFVGDVCLDDFGSRN